MRDTDKPEGCGEPAGASRPHPDLPKVLGPGSNVAYLTEAEHARVMADFAVIGRGLGWFGRMSEHDYRLALERSLRPLSFGG